MFCASDEKHSLNGGASYLLNDRYRRFLRTAARESESVRVSKAATLLPTVVSAAVTCSMDSITGAWKLLIATAAGTGGVLLAGWYWWRINAWSEVSAMISAFAVSISLQTAFGLDSGRRVPSAWLMIVTVAVTTAVWLAVTFLTPPARADVPLAFHRRTQPCFRWGPLARQAPEVRPAR